MLTKCNAPQIYNISNVAIDNEELVIENAEDINVSKILAILSLPIKQLNS
ncbi:MAG: hypothetical protein F6K17_27410 [Okeania sp. SIO3C4]|nr:hypothetical protein [Okeania sp. SIO3C4]